MPENQYGLKQMLKCDVTRCDLGLILKTVLRVYIFFLKTYKEKKLCKTIAPTCGVEGV